MPKRSGQREGRQRAPAFCVFQTSRRSLLLAGRTGTVKNLAELRSIGPESPSAASPMRRCMACRPSCRRSGMRRGARLNRRVSVQLLHVDDVVGHRGSRGASTTGTREIDHIPATVVLQFRPIEIAVRPLRESLKGRPDQIVDVRRLAMKTHSENRAPGSVPVSNLRSSESSPSRRPTQTRYSPLLGSKAP